MKNLNLEIEKLLSQNASDLEIAKTFKSYFTSYVNTIDTSVETINGKDFFIKHTKFTDNFLIVLYKYILRKNFAQYQPMSSNIPIVLIALGSYGREQLCIYSDIDILILYEEIKGYKLKDIIEEFVTLAWDCGLKFSSRVHEINEVENSVKKDITIKTSILESRMIYGSKYLWYLYENKLSTIRKTNQKNFILAKFEEHKKRLEKYPLNMQMNIKDGYGGIRESNMLYWVATTLYGVSNVKQLINKEFTEEEYKRYRQTLEFIFQVRNVLHNIAKKKQDLVTFDLLPELSVKLGFEDSVRFTKERQCIAKLLYSLHTIHNFTASQTNKLKRKIIVDTKNISLLKKYRHTKNIYIIDDIVYTSFNTKAKSLNNIMKELINLPSNIKKFDSSYTYYLSKTKIPKIKSKELIKNIKLLLVKEKIYPILKTLYNANLLHIILPTMKNILNQPQFDGYHQHPTDIHSLKTLKFVENIQDEFLKELYDLLSQHQKIILRLVCLFHDIGKGKKGDHHIIGEKMFRETFSTLNFDETSIQIGAMLTRHHNKMSQVAKNEDIYSQKVILNFTGLVKDIDTLRMLYIVTYCDISAVKQEFFNNSISSLLKRLYLNSLPAFENKDLLNENSRRMTKINAIKKLKAYDSIPNTIKKKINDISSNQIFLQLKAQDLLDIVIKANKVDDYIYKIKNNNHLSIRIIKKIPLNLGYLLGRLEFLNINTMNIFKLFKDIKAFEINFCEKIDENDIPYIKEIIENSFDMNKKTKSLKPTIYKKDIKINTNYTKYLASIHIKTKDQKGLFAYIASILDDFNIDIETAKLHTSKGYAKDLLLIEKDGNFCHQYEDIVDLICKE